MAVMSPRDPLGRAVLRTVLIVVAVAVALYVVVQLRKPITWLVIAAFIAVAMSGPIHGLARKTGRRGLSIAIAYLSLILIPIAIGALLIPSLVGQIENLAKNVPQYAADVTEFVNDNQTLNDLNDKYNFTSEIQKAADDLPSRIGDAANVLQDIGVGVVNSIFAAITILILSIFMVAGGPRWRAAFVRSQSADQAPRIERALNRIADAVANYVGGALLQATIAGVSAFIVLEHPRGAVRRAPGTRRRLLRPDPGGGSDDRRGRHRNRDAVRQLPDRGHRLGDLGDRLPADRELRDPATDPGQGGSGGGVRDSRRGAVRLDPVRGHGRDPCDPGRGVVADRVARVPRLPPRAADQAGPAGSDLAVPGTS